MLIRQNILARLAAIAAFFLVVLTASSESKGNFPINSPKTVEEKIRPDSIDSAIVVRLQDLCENEIFERTQLGLYVYDLTCDTLLFEKGSRQLLRPASCEKLITAITALDLLGTDYKYSTSLYVDGNINDSILNGNVYVRAGFDPRFGRDDLHAFVQALAEKGIKEISGDVVFDVSMKDTLSYGWGWCWDDDVPRLTPLLYNGKDKFKEAFAELMAEEGISLKGTMQTGRLSTEAHILVTRTHTIDQILLQMMKESDNLYAESLFYQIAAQSGRAYAGRERAAAYVKQLIRRVGLEPSHYQIADGSGLSLYNYVTTELVGNLLRYAYTHNEIYLHLMPSLPVAGDDGTLRNRMRNSTARDKVFAKTGTVEGVSSLSGYATAANGHLLCFSIINQGLRYHSTGRNFQDRICNALTR